MTTTDTSAPPPANEQRARWTWVGVVLGLLGGCLLIQGVLLAKALGDPSFAAEPDYYRKAIAWEDHQAQQLVNETLGWQLELGVTPALTGQSVAVTLSDAEGRPIGDAIVTLEAFHKARRRHPVQATLRTDGTGAATAELPLRRAGLWELRWTVEQGGQRFTQVIERDLVGA